MQAIKDFIHANAGTRTAGLCAKLNSLQLGIITKAQFINIVEARMDQDHAATIRAMLNA